MRYAALAALFLVWQMPAHADALQEIDRAVEEIAQYVRERIADEESTSISVEAFPSDRSGKNLLGQRMKSALELAISSAYEETRVLSSAGGENHYTLAGEFQPFQEKTRLIVRVLRSDGSIAGGLIVDMHSDPEFAPLLLPSSIVISERPPKIEDAYESDDNPGFEIEVKEFEVSVFERSIAQGDRDRFIFQISEPKTVIVQTLTETDPRIGLYSEGEGEPFAVNDDADGEGASRLEIELDAGVYVAEITGYDEFVAGPYRVVLDLSGTVNDEYEPDNSITEASLLQTDERQMRVLVDQDEDWAELRVDSPGFYTLSTEGTAVDTQISVFNLETGEAMLSDDNSGHLSNAYVGMYVGTTGIVARIDATEVSEQGSYELVLQELKPARISHDGSWHEVELVDVPQYIVLRVLQPGRYRVSTPGAISEIDVQLYNLPIMQRVEWEHADPSSGFWTVFLDPADYLLRLRSADPPENFGVIVAEEQTEERLQNGDAGRQD